MKVAVFRREYFNAAHKLYKKEWSDEQNFQVFGKCSSPNFHGHNYELVVKIVGEVNPITGYVVDLKWLSAIIKEQVIDRLDHKNLNIDTEEFKILNPTAENIAIVIYNLIQPHLAAELDLQITLHETPKNFVQYPAN